MGLMSVIAAFLREIYFSVMAIFRLSKSENSSMQVFYAAFALFAIAVFAYYLFFKVTLSKREVTLVFGIVILFLSFMLVPRILYGPYNENFRSQVLVVLAGSLPAFLVGVVLRRSDKINNMCALMPTVIIIFTVTSIIVTFFSSSSTTGGYISDKSGLNYQEISYLSANALGLNLFYIKNKQNIIETGLFKSRYCLWLFYCLIPVQVLSLLVGGGRGAFVLSLVLLVYYFCMDAKNVKKNLNSIVFLFIGLLAVILILPLLNVENSGFERILSLFEGHGAESRTEIWEQAIDYFSMSPIIGHGAGAVPYLFEVYSHNFFMDVLVEYGAIGIVLSIVIVVSLLKRLVSAVKDDPRNHLIAVLFIFSFVMLMFSGYWYSHVSIWFIVGYIFSSKTDFTAKVQKISER